MLNYDRLARRVTAFCDFFESVGELTTCKRKPVGCGVFDLACNHVAALAHNGPPDGTDKDSCEGDDPCGCGHSEPIAMMRLNPRDWRDGELLIYTSAAPCLKCALVVIASQKIKFWLYKPTWYPTTVMNDVVRPAGIIPVPMDIFEMLLPEDERRVYKEPTKNPESYSVQGLQGQLLEHAREYYPNFPFNLRKDHS